MKYICYGVRGSRPTPYSGGQLAVLISQFMVNADKDMLLRIADKVEKINNSTALPSRELFKELCSMVKDEIDSPRYGTLSIGSNTPCVEIRSTNPKDEQVIFDLGTGAVDIEILPKTKVLHIFFTHFHYDHVQGMLFCNYLYNKDMTVHFYSPVVGFEKYLHELMNHPYFPVTMSESMTSRMYFHDLSVKNNIRINDMVFTWKEIPHPGGSHAYKVSNKKQKFCYFTDVNIGDSLQKKTKENIEFLSGVDTMILDSAMAFEDGIVKKYWGHTSIYTGIDFAKFWGVKKLRLFHTEPTDDVTLFSSLYQSALWYKKAIDADIDIELAQEGIWNTV